MSGGMRLEFTATAQKDLKKLNQATQKQIVKKLKFFLDQPGPLRFAAKLTGLSKGGNYRFRVGGYRVVFDVKKGVIFALYIEHRHEVYRRR